MMPRRIWNITAVIAVGSASAAALRQDHPFRPGGVAHPWLTADRCIACHKGVQASDGTDVSIGYDWRASMMANSARDPYWQAAVRREILDYPDAAAEIEDECASCHMPMASRQAKAEGRSGKVFANLAVGGGAEAALAADGVSCALCHRIAPDNLGSEETFVGRFQTDGSAPPGGPPVFGPFEPDSGGAGIMRSATGFRPQRGEHVTSSGLCASCHTVLTHGVAPEGADSPEFPEQVPYLEWQASAYAASGQTCQSCHMPEVGEDVPVTMVLGQDRPNVSRHVFRGGNFFMLRMLNRYRGELGVTALPAELALAAARTEDHLKTAAATVTILSGAVRRDSLDADVEVRNLAGHKLPTAYPARRAWLRVAVTDARGRSVFESGAFLPDGRIAGDDHDEDGSRYEPHYDVIRSPGQVQVYQAVMADREGAVTTGLRSAARWLKDNRILPDGFDAESGGSRVAVHGAARSDSDFAPGRDRVRYSVAVDSANGPFIVTAQLWFQPIAYRWAENLAAYDSEETRRFVGYYRAMAAASAIRIAEDSRPVG